MSQYKDGLIRYRDFHYHGRLINNHELCFILTFSYHNKTHPRANHTHHFGSHVLCDRCQYGAGTILPTWWHDQMETSSALLATCAGNSSVPSEFPTQSSVTRSFDGFFLSVWINGWVNNREVGDLRRYRAHYDVTVMNIEHMTNMSNMPSLTVYLHDDDSEYWWRISHKVK